MAWQKGWIPLTRTVIEQAIRLNGVAVDANLAAFAWGRRIAVQPALAVTDEHGTASHFDTSTLDGLIAHRSLALAKYQNEAYAARYRAEVEKVRRVEQERAPGRTELTEAVARYGYKLMAYKDEYEVARLLSDPAFSAQIARDFEGPYRVLFHMAPPLFARRDRLTGHLKKRAYGRGAHALLGFLAKFKWLRGTFADPFGYTAERRVERSLIDAYFSLLKEISARLSPANYAIAIGLASLPDDIRGFGHVKEANVARIAERRRDLLDRLDRGFADPKAETQSSPRVTAP
jgi:indolepyruvate ferredoxin oxidoreductase